MKLIEFKEQTVVIAKDQPEYQPLPAFQFAHDPSGRIACCWQLTWRERLKLLFTGKLWHTVMTFNQPLQPQLLELKKPFTPEDVAERETEMRAALERRNFELDLVAKYGADVRRRQKLHDERGYHPNDRRRCVKVEPADFQACKKYGVLFLGGARIVDSEYHSAV